MYKCRSSGTRRGASAGRRAGPQLTVQPQSASAAQSSPPEHHSGIEAPAVSSASGRHLPTNAAAGPQADSSVSQAAFSSRVILRPSAGQLADDNVGGTVVASEQQAAATLDNASSDSGATSVQKQGAESALLPESMSRCTLHFVKHFKACGDLTVWQFCISSIEHGLKVQFLGLVASIDVSKHCLLLHAQHDHHTETDYGFYHSEGTRYLYMCRLLSAFQELPQCAGLQMASEGYSAATHSKLIET